MLRGERAITQEEPPHLDRELKHGLEEWKYLFKSAPKMALQPRVSLVYLLGLLANFAFLLLF